MLALSKSACCLAFALAIILVGILCAIYFQTQPRLAARQAPLADLPNIEDLRTQDIGKTRLLPASLAGSGGTIYSERETLEAQVRILLEK